MAQGSVHGGGHSSRSRSSSGGSSSFGGNHSSGGYKRLPDAMGHRNGYRRPPRHYHWFGRNVVVTSGKGMLVSVLLIILLFASIILAVSISSYNKQQVVINNYVTSGKTYEEICEKAKAKQSGYYLFEFKNVDGQALDTGVWSDGSNTLESFEDDTLDYQNAVWFLIEYSFYDDADNHIFERTYSMYSASDIRGITEFSVAYTKINGVWWSINSDFKLENNIEYLYELDELNSTKVMKNVCIAIVATVGAILVLSVVVIILKSKKISEISLEENVNEMPTDSTSKKTKYCPYCGDILDENAKRCPSCGAKRLK